MALKWSLVLVAAFIATVMAQTTTNMAGEATQDIPTTMETTMSPTTADTTMAMPTTTEMVMPTTEGPTDDPLIQRFNMPLSRDVRSNHFYCLGANGNREEFQNFRYRWGLWIQYPVLSYLDSMRKRHLFYVISQMTGESIFGNICVAEVEHYGVSTYSESVFVKLYLRNQDDATANATFTRLDRAFRGALAAINPPNPYVEPFLGRRALNVSSTEPSDNGPVLSDRTVNDSVLAGCDVDSCPEGDPTLLAVVLGTYVGPWNYSAGAGAESEEVTVELLRSGSLTGYTFIQNFASNPRPINFGLEPGDIVFAVFGSIFLTLLSAAIVIGFFIHPFFFA